MSNIIDSIQLSGTVYILSAQTSGSGNPTVELTQAEYDALVTAGTVQADTYYIITDATAIDPSNYYTTAQTDTKISQATSGLQVTLTAGTGIDITDNVISATGGGGGGKAIEAGRGITVTTGETADTVSFNLPISAGTNNGLVFIDTTNSTNGNGCVSIGRYCQASGTNSFAQGYNTKASSYYSHSEGEETTASGSNSHSEGAYVYATNPCEHSQGKYNVSNKANTTWGDSGNTLFSVGNGTSTSARHNAFEIRQNGDIYITSGGTDIKLQDNLGGGGGGSSYTAGTGIDITNNVISVNSGVVTTDTEQTISGRKIFTYSANSGKAIEFKQTSNTAKVGFSIKNSAETNNELASFEFRPNTFTIDAVQHPLLYFGHYRSTAIANAGVPQTVIGFRQYDQLNAAAYHYLMPLPEKAKTPFSLTTSFKDYYAPIGFKNGSTMITADNTGVVDLSSELGGLKLVKLSQSEYDALSPNYDSNTLYVIVN